jgi:phosphopantothenoylcysteine synthetase/decarboxylase
LADVMRAELGAWQYDAVVHSMAVLDYVPATYVDEKTPSGQERWSIELVRAPKVIKIIKKLQPTTFLISFKLEVGKSQEELVAAAHRSLMSNQSDLVLANDLREIEQGCHVGYLVNQDGEVEAMAEGKEEIARLLLDAVAGRSRAQSG